MCSRPRRDPARRSSRCSSSCCCSPPFHIATAWWEGKRGGQRVFLGVEGSDAIARPDSAPADLLWSSLAQFSRALCHYKKKTQTVSILESRLPQSELFHCCLWTQESARWAGNLLSFPHRPPEGVEAGAQRRRAAQPRHGGLLSARLLQQAKTRRDSPQVPVPGCTSFTGTAEHCQEPLQTDPARHTSDLQRSS